MTTNQTRLAIVTGAAGGMGSACAVRLAEGWSLIPCDIDAARLELVAAPLRAPGLAIDLLAGSIADADVLVRLAAAIADRPIGAVIHTAGVSPTMDNAERIMAINYDATVRLLDLTWLRMLAGGCAVLIASSSAYSATQPKILAAIDAIPADSGGASLMPLTQDNPGFAYMISKRAVIRLFKRQATAFGKRGARIMSISPGLIDPPMGRREQQAHPQMDKMLEMTPLERYGTSDEIAKVALFLCSPAASFVSGSDIKVDGGVLAAMS